MIYEIMNNYNIKLSEFDIAKFVASSYLETWYNTVNFPFWKEKIWHVFIHGKVRVHQFTFNDTSKTTQFFLAFLILKLNSVHCVIKVLAAVVWHARPFIKIMNSALKRSFFILLLLHVLILLIALPPCSSHAFVSGMVNASFAIHQICWHSSASEMKPWKRDGLCMLLWKLN